MNERERRKKCINNQQKQKEARRNKASGKWQAKTKDKHEPTATICY